MQNDPQPATGAGADCASRVRENLARVRQTIADACTRGGRDVGAVRLVAVTKYVDLPVIRELLSAGAADLGESRVQQLIPRAAALGSRLDGWPEPPSAPLAAAPPAVPTPRWHMIGHLQRNKVRQLLPQVRIIHSLDSMRLAEEMEHVASEINTHVEALLEVNVSGEPSKYGLQPDQVEPLLRQLDSCPHIRLRGLMTMAPFDPDPEHARPCFARLRELLSRLRDSGAAGPDFTHLSMGMTQDYAVAVEEGATLVRVGSALFEGLPGQ